MNLPRNGDTLCFLLSCLELGNNANRCYANASYLALCWAYGSCDAFQWDHFAGDEHLLDKLWNQPIGSPHSLEAWFPLLFSHITWGVNPADAAEFTAILHQRGCSKSLTAAWERRCEVRQKVAVRDQGSRTMPVVLQHIGGADHVDFDHLLSTWTQELGMVAAFTMTASGEPADLLCCHIDRAVQLDGASTVEKRNFAVRLDTTCLFPFFIDDGLNALWYGYVPVALLIHTGSWTGGHWRAVVRFDSQPLEDAVWFITDDHTEMQPAPQAQLETWILEGVTTIWCCKASSLALWNPLRNPVQWPMIKHALLRHAPTDEQQTEVGLASQDSTCTEDAMGNLS